MPELAEVEMIRRVLEPQLRGRTVTKLSVLRPEVVAHPQAEQFAQEVCGAVIGRLYLQILFADGARAVVHLRMTGRLLVLPENTPEKKYTHLILSLDNGQELRFMDMRRFGRWWYLKKDEKDDFTGIETLGPEPFDERLPDISAKRREAAERRSRIGCSASSLSPESEIFIPMKFCLRPVFIRGGRRGR